MAYSVPGLALSRCFTVARSSRRREYVQRDTRVVRKSAIPIAEDDGKSCSGAVGASKVDLAVIVEISGPSGAGFLPYRPPS